MLGELTCDAVCRGLLRLWQPKSGYRFNLDGILLGAAASSLMADGPAVDVGAGAGIVGLLFARVTGRQVMLVERVPEIAALAQKNARENLLDVPVVMADFRALPLPGRSVRLLMCNPPYLTPGHGRSSPNPHRQLSREALHGGAVEALVEASRVLSDNGQAVIITPAPVSPPPGLFQSSQCILRRTAAGPVERVISLYARQPSTALVQTRALNNDDGTPGPWLHRLLEGDATGAALV